METVIQLIENIPPGARELLAGTLVALIVQGLKKVVRKEMLAGTGFGRWVKARLTGGTKQKRVAKVLVACVFAALTAALDGYALGTLTVTYVLSHSVGYTTAAVFSHQIWKQLIRGGE